MTANQAGAQSYERSEPHDANAAQRNQIAQTRADLGNTLTELAARTDVKARTRQAVSQARDRAKNQLRERAQSATTRTRQAVAQARHRAKNELQERAQFATMRTQEAASSGASSARDLRERAGRTPASIPVGGAVAALAALGIYAVLRRRSRSHRTAPSRWTPRTRARAQEWRR